MLFVRCTLCHTPVYGKVELLEDQLVMVSAAGTITAILPGDQESAALAAHGAGDLRVMRLGEHQFLLPGFVDVHLHASQYSYAGTATDTPLMAWLERFTFPTEQRFATDPAFARAVYSALLARLVACGTTTAVMYATQDLEPCCLLADLAEEAGLRALLGKVCMDRNTPDSYRESTEVAATNAEAYIQYVRSKGCSRLQPVLTPRFVPTCTPELLARLGQLAVRYGVHVQSHVSESYDAVAFVEKLHPEVEGRELRLFDVAGLLTDKAIFAHATLMTAKERKLLAARGAAIAHCPLSNMFFADRVLPVAELLRAGVKIGLGTDVAGGYDASMLSAIRHAVLASRALHIQRIEQAEDPANLALQYQARGDPDLLTWKEGLWLATMGGAHAIGLQDTIGSFAVGKQFDAMLVDGGGGGAYHVFSDNLLLSQVEKFVNCGDDRHIGAVWVDGMQIK